MLGSIIARFGLLILVLGGCILFSFCLIFLMVRHRIMRVSYLKRLRINEDELHLFDQLTNQKKLI